MKFTLLFLAAICFVSTTLAQEVMHGKVRDVIDGNTLMIVTFENEEYKVLLHGIDSPDPGQEYAAQAKTLLEKLLLNKSVTITMKGKDRLGNRLGEIHVDGAVDARHELVKAGLAWTSEKSPNPELEQLKEEARRNNIGLWKDENPTPPWVYRRQQSMLEAKSS
jgi:endonuclease YncB( thermonuclease family)